MSSDIIMVIVRLVLGVIMLYYGWPKVRNLRQNAKDFEIKGFAPGLLWGTVVALVEFVGGMAILVGAYPEVSAGLYAFQMLVGTIWKLKARKPFTDYSYDLQLLSLCLVLSGLGPDSHVVWTLGPVLLLKWSVVLAAIIAALVLVYLPGMLGFRAGRWTTPTLILGRRPR